MADNEVREENMTVNKEREENMANNEEREGRTSRGNEWEVVSLTESAYAAAPGPKKVELKESIMGDTPDEDGTETSRALFMSSHFVFPPSQHENLPSEPDSSEIHTEHVGKDAVSEFGAEEGGRSNRKDEEDWDLKGLDIPEEFPVLKEFEGGTNLQGLNLSDKENSIFSAPAFSSFHSETALGGSPTYGENTIINEATEPSECGVDFSADISQSPKPAKDLYDGSDLPCEAWWKRRAASLYAHAKEANTVWSIFIAAAVMGLVILGHRWQQERWQALQLKCSSNSNEKTGKMLGPICRLKDVIVGGHPRGTSISGSSSRQS
ncbi:hypothetical protein CFOL_v3_25191 [Cephalotus follicularis]|uniref:Uncharacterized protein n=1 Tax=Cephalotus follicularis TaxID=3775 RepID=A0A1Q3CNC4_CEPFO|nr:hypothetical protein CFOL_v3_25191 [Cephalotus follicularis]